MLGRAIESAEVVSILADFGAVCQMRRPQRIILGIPGTAEGEAAFPGLGKSGSARGWLQGLQLL